jgi:peptidoglycan/xylan/chitin deacetylase (PgdA/CDA1 family)
MFGTAKISLKTFVRTVVYQTGFFSLLHLLKNRDTLTVVMFHRVLPKTDPRYIGADPEWTMTPQTFESCIKFFLKHYHVVSPNTVFSSLDNHSKLPTRALLITFDDGWADTSEYAIPILNSYKISALLFVAGCAIDESRPFWQEQIFYAISASNIAVQKVKETCQKFGVEFNDFPTDRFSEKDIRKLIACIAVNDAEVCLGIATSLYKTVGFPEQMAMISGEQLRHAVNTGHTVGAHGQSHTPLTEVPDIECELRESKQSVRTSLPGQPVTSISFPHGKFSQAVLDACAECGFNYLFSSQSYLNPSSKRSKEVKPLARIHISEREIVSKKGHLSRHMLASQLFTRPTF